MANTAVKTKEIWEMCGDSCPNEIRSALITFQMVDGMRSFLNCSYTTDMKMYSYNDWVFLGQISEEIQRLTEVKDK